MLSNRMCSHAAGISLVESLIVVAVSAIVLAAGAPAFGHWVRDLEVRSSAAALLGALQAARIEAVTRNAEVRLALGDAQGRAGWVLSCVRTSAQCPATIRTQPVSIGGRVRWGAVALTAMPGFDIALDAGAGLPGRVGFDAVGAAPGVVAGTDIARIDVTHADGADAHRLIVLVSGLGRVRVCDPQAASAHPEHCH